MDSQRENIRAVIQRRQQQQQRSLQEEEEVDPEADRDTSTSDYGGQEGCSAGGLLLAPYNTEPNVVPFQGLMFDIASREQAIDIYSLTLDVVAAGVDVDLSVDVWTTAGTFHSSYFNESAWTRIVHADSTQMVRNPMTSSHGAVIPAHAFDTTISMNPRERRAFYVRLKNGSHLDYSVDAFVQDAEYTAKTNELAIYPGFGIGMATTVGADAGAATELFPQALERPLRPIFAGAIHYQTLCSNTAVKTTTKTPIKYVILMNQAITTALFQQISIAMDLTMDYAMRKDQVLGTYQQDYDLQALQGETKTKEVPVPGGGNGDAGGADSGGCPSGWERCFAMESTALVQHDTQLSADDVHVTLYQYWEELVRSIQSSFPDAKVDYVGLKIAETLYDITLYNVPHHNVAAMDEVQSAYFVQETTQFINKKLLKDESEQTRVLRMQVRDQRILTRRSRQLMWQQQQQNHQPRWDPDHRLLQDAPAATGSIQIHGSMTGLQIAKRDWYDFAKTLESVLYSNEVEYALHLSFSVNYVKGEMGEQNRYQYFEDISKVKSEVQPDAALMPTAAPTTSADARSHLNKGLELGKEAAGSVDNRVWMTVGICVAGVVIIPLLWYLYSQWRRQAKQRREATEKAVKREKRRKAWSGGKWDRKKNQHTYDQEKPKETPRPQQKHSQQASSSATSSPPPPTCPPPPPLPVPPMNPVASQQPNTLKTSTAQLPSSQAPTMHMTIQEVATDSRSSDRHNKHLSLPESSSSHERRSSRGESGRSDSHDHRRSSSRDGSRHSHGYRRSSSRDGSGHNHDHKSRGSRDASGHDSKGSRHEIGSSSSHHRRSCSRDGSVGGRTSPRDDNGSHHKSSSKTGGSSHHRRSHSGDVCSGSHHDGGHLQQLFASSLINKQHPDELRLSQSLHSSSTGNPTEASMFRFTRSAVPSSGGEQHNGATSQEQPQSAHFLPLSLVDHHRNRNNDFHHDDLRHSHSSTRSSRSSSSDRLPSLSTSRHGIDGSRQRALSSSSHHSHGDSSNRSSSRDRDRDCSSGYPPRRHPERRTKSFEEMPSRQSASLSKDDTDGGRPRRRSMDDDCLSQSLSSNRDPSSSGNQRRGGRRDHHHHHEPQSSLSSQSHHARLESVQRRAQDPSGCRPDGTGSYS
jgi:hypothetical protein